MRAVLFPLVLLLALQDAGREARVWVQKLGSDRPEDREEAARKLKSLGDAALPSLREGAAGSDAEIAARAKELIAVLGIRRTLHPRLLETLPGVEERLARGPESVWMDVFLEATREDLENTRRHPAISRPEHLNSVAARALKVADDSVGLRFVLSRAADRRLRGAIPEMIELLSHAAPEIRAGARAALVKLDAREAVGGLVELARDPPFLERDAVAETLREIDPEGAMAALRKHTHDPALNLRVNVLQTLAELGDPKSLAPLAEFAHAKESSLRHGALSGLERFHSPNEAPALEEYLSDSDPDVRLAVLRGLERNKARTEGAILRALEDPDERVRLRAVILAGKWKLAGAVPALRRRLLDAKGPAGAAAVALSRLKATEAIPDLLAAVEKGADSYGALHVLVELKAPGAVPYVIQELGSARVDRRITALKQLAEIGAREAAPAVVPLLADPDGSARQEAARALGRLAAPGTAPALIPLLEKEDVDLAVAAAQALADLSAKEAVPELLKRLENAKPPVRVAAARALGDLGAQEAIPGIVTLFTEEGEGFQEAAILALRSLGIRHAVPSLEKALPKAKNRVFLMLSLADERQPEFLRLVAMLHKDPEVEVRRFAALIFEAWQDPGAIPTLLELRRDPDEETRLAAAIALARLGREEFYPDVLQALDHKDQAFRFRAVRAASLIRSEEASARVARALDDPVREVRVLSVQGLAYINNPISRRALAGVLQHPDAEMRLVAAASLDRVEAPDRVSAALSLLDDARRSIRVAAAKWLCSQGRSEGVNTILDEDWNPGELALDGVRKPELWKRLAQPWARGPYRGTCAGLFEQIARDTGLALEKPAASDLTERLSRPVTLSRPPGLFDFPRHLDTFTLRDALDDALSTVGLRALLEDDRLRLVSADEASRFWKRWRAERERAGK